MGKKIGATDLLKIWTERSLALIDTSNKLYMMSALLCVPQSDIYEAIERDPANGLRDLVELKELDEQGHNKARAKLRDVVESTTLETGPVPIDDFDDLNSFIIAWKNCITIAGLIAQYGVHVDAEALPKKRLDDLRKLDAYAYLALADAHQLLGYWNQRLGHTVTRTGASRKIHHKRKMARMEKVLSIYEKKRKANLHWEDLSDSRKADIIAAEMGDKAPGKSTIRGYLQEARKGGLLESNVSAEAAEEQ
jgi:hypothetical protein